MAKRKYKKRKATKKRASKIDLTIVGLLILSILLGVLIYGKSGVVGIKLNEILGGIAHMGVGVAEGDQRALDAAMAAMDSPLLETSVKGAKGKRDSR